MSTELLLPDVHAALRAAVEARAADAPNRLPLQPETSAEPSGDVRAGRAHGARRRRRWPHGLPLLLGGILIAGSGVAATTVWNPFASEPDAPRAIRGPAPAEHLASLGIFRRAQRDSDRTARVTAGLSKFRTQEGRGVYVDAVRVVGQTNFGGYCSGVGVKGRMVCHQAPATAILFPRTRGKSDRYGTTFVGDHGVPICVWNVYDVWETEGGWPPPGLKRPKGDPEPTRPPRLEDRVLAGGSCTSMHQVRMKGLWAGGSLSMGNLLGVVPDRVAAVRVSTSDGQVVMAKARDNIVRLVAPGPTHRFHQGSLRWLDASGKVIRRF